ncbi:hypothetical protein Dimus_001869 [Dionaea muscipula]
MPLGSGLAPNQEVSINSDFPRSVSFVFLWFLLWVVVFSVGLSEHGEVLGDAGGTSELLAPARAQWSSATGWHATASAFGLGGAGRDVGSLWVLVLVADSAAIEDRKDEKYASGNRLLKEFGLWIYHKIKVLALKGSYHGDTLGAMEAQGPSTYTGLLQQPWCSSEGFRY